MRSVRLGGDWIQLGDQLTRTGHCPAPALQQFVLDKVGDGLGRDTTVVAVRQTRDIVRERRIPASQVLRGPGVAPTDILLDGVRSNRTDLIRKGTNLLLVSIAC